MKFNDINYTRPDVKVLTEKFNVLLKKFETASAAEQKQLMSDINALRSDFETMATLSSIRHTIDTNNEFYNAEKDFYDNNGPAVEGLISEYYKALIKSPHRSGLEKEYGKQLFTIAEMSVKTFSPEIIEDLQKENQLGSEYTKILASAKINFDGKELNLSDLAKYTSSDNRETRQNANKKKYEFFTEHASELDRIYDDLVKTRHKMARKLGFKNFVEMAYFRMLRSDYNSEMVAFYRQQVEKFIVPIATKLRQKQAERLGLNKLKYYDEAVDFKTGNAAPKGDADWILKNAVKMYSELSPETKVFFDHMVNDEMMDLVSRKGKAGGGYCTYIGAEKSPFIFSNFNGTKHDITVLTHEAGHAFQAYSSRNLSVPEYFFPTYEAAEIHSMSMEFITWPWMDLFFKEETEKFKFSHLSSSLLFLPYGVAVDEFQHWVYENYEATPAERNTAWRNIEKKYMPHRDYDGNEFLEKGGFWQQQQHIYRSPFYYIDYTLAQICAFQFWKKSTENRTEALADYTKLCKEGGSHSFLKLVEIAKLVSPFSGGCLESVANEVNNWLEKVDDSKF